MVLARFLQSGGFIPDTQGQGFGSVLPGNPLGTLSPPSLEDVSATPLSSNYVPSAYQPTPSWLERQSIAHELDIRSPGLTVGQIVSLHPEEATDLGMGFAGATTPGSIAGAVGRTISTRFPEAVKATEAALTNHDLIINSEVAGRDPVLLAKKHQPYAQLFKSYGR